MFVFKTNTHAKPKPKTKSKTSVAQSKTRVARKASQELLRRRYPTRQKAAEWGAGWTGGGFKNVCAAMAGMPADSVRAGRIIQGLKAYMKNSAPVAPNVPHSLASRAPTVFYRGISSAAIPATGDVVASGRRDCFTAVTYDQTVAKDIFAKTSGFLFRLQIDRIARGTPWVWFHRGRNTRDRNTLPTLSWGDESEVLLPPGAFKVLGRWMSGGMPIIDVAYAPSAEYLRRGVLPAVAGENTLRYKTTGGHRLDMRSKAMTQGLTARLAPGRRR